MDFTPDRKVARAPVRLSYGSLSLKTGEPGLGLGTAFAMAIVKVLHDAEGIPFEVMAEMEIPKDMRNLRDEELIERFINGFGGRNPQAEKTPTW